LADNVLLGKMKNDEVLLERIRNPNESHADNLQDEFLIIYMAQKN